LPLLALKARECRIEIPGDIRNGIGETCRIDCRLGHARAHMRARYKGRVPDDRHPAERDLRRLEVEDRLEERRGVRAKISASCGATARDRSP
jgi:hypothetical protein